MSKCHADIGLMNYLNRCRTRPGHLCGCETILELWCVILGLDFGWVLTFIVQDAFASMAREAGIALCTAPETSLFFVALNRCLVPLVTLKWLEDASGFLEASVLDAA